MSELGFVPVSENDQTLGELLQHFIGLMVAATQTTEKLSPIRFPGTMALTLSRRHLQMICANDYVALEKSDGTRYMLLSLDNCCFLIDRLMKFYLVEPNPLIWVPPDLPEGQRETLLDGELVFNMITEQWEFLIYDAVSIFGDISIAQKDFRVRMSSVELHVARPSFMQPAYAGVLRMRVKDYYEKKDIRKLFQHVKKTPNGEYVYINDDRRDGVICNHNDGVIFTPVQMPYQVKNCSALLKWKPPHLNSVDFMLKLERAKDPRRPNEPTVKTHIAYKGERGIISLREVFFPSRHKREWANDFHRYNNSIVELSYDRMAGEWRYIRQREDKETPNFSSTVIDTMESITESMEREELVRFLERHTKPPPPKAQAYVNAQSRNEQICTVRNDLYDAENRSYLLTTPMSLIPPPYEQVERLPKGRGRSKAGRHGAPKIAQPNSESQQDAEDGEGRGREKPDYSDDV